MRVLITGGLGFLGCNLSQYLAEQGHDVRILDNLTAHADVPANSEGHTIRGDIRNGNDLSRALSGVDTIVHLAAMPGVETCADKPVESLEVNVQGTLNLLRWATMEGVKSFVLASSVGAVLGTQVQPAREDQTPHPESIYGWSKLMAERIAGEFDHEMTVTVLRFTNMYGPYCQLKNNIIPKLLLRKPDVSFPIYGDGKQTRDFLYAEDACKAIVSAVETEVGGLFHIGSGSGVSMLELVRIVEHVTGDHIPLEYLDERPGDVKDNYTSTEKAGERLGWSPGISLEEGVKRTCRWLRESGYVKNPQDTPEMRRQRVNEILSKAEEIS